MFNVQVFIELEFLPGKGPLSRQIDLLFRVGQGQNKFESPLPGSGHP